MAKRASRSVGAALLLILAIGCQGKDGPSATARRTRATAPPQSGRVRQVACLYDTKPWLSVDPGGDMDPEGLQYRVFLVTEQRRGELRDGMFHIQLYRIERKDGKIERKLASDWHYPTDAWTKIKSPMLGMGYHIRIYWASKDIAGSEVELITRYEDPQGRFVSAGTKRFRVPKFES